MAEEATVPLMNPASTCPRVTSTCPSLSLVSPAITSVGIIGTGYYAVALCKRLVMVGYDVTVGSRCPDVRDSRFKRSSRWLAAVRVTTVTECVRSCPVILVAIQSRHFAATLQPLAGETKGRVVVDVSNRERRRYTTCSNAEHLASILPEARVVKAFNNISAHQMEQLTTDGSRVYVAGDDPSSRTVVCQLATSLGFLATELGGLGAALDMEDSVLEVFSAWRLPLLLTFGLFNLWTLYVIFLYFIEDSEYRWEQIFLKILNKPLCMTAFTLLALTYLPGHLAAMLQIYHGTKHRPFPNFLDSWLKSRKQLGLVSLLLVSCHVIASILMLSPTYYRSWFHSYTLTLSASSNLSDQVLTELTLGSAWMVWKGEAACLVGISAFVLMVIIGLTSIPSVGQALNWSEWRCVHSNLSYAVLLLAASHVIIMGAPNWIRDGPMVTFRSITFLSLVLPFTVIVLKLFFLCTPLKGYLAKIRHGWERRQTISPDLSPESEKYKVSYTEARYSMATGVPKTACCSQAKINGVAQDVNGDALQRVQCNCSHV